MANIAAVNIALAYLMRIDDPLAVFAVEDDAGNCLSLFEDRHRKNSLKKRILTDRIAIM